MKVKLHRIVVTPIEVELLDACWSCGLSLQEHKALIQTSYVEAWARASVDGENVDTDGADHDDRYLATKYECNSCGANAAPTWELRADNGNLVEVFGSKAEADERAAFLWPNGGGRVVMEGTVIR